MADDRSEELGQLEPIADEDQEQLVDSGLLQEPSARSFVECYRTSSFPFVVLDHALRIVWANDGFFALFGRRESLLGASITLPFRPYLDDQRSGELYREVRSAASGFSWRGRVETHARDFPAIIANLMIAPLAPPKSSFLAATSEWWTSSPIKFAFSYAAPS